MAEMVRSRQISPSELMKAQLQQIQQINPALNAVVEYLEPPSAPPLPGPLHGVPFSIKDSIDVAGVKTTAGTLGRRNAPPARKNATLVDRLVQAGAVPIVKTNLPDLLFSFETDNLIYGRTNNPYDLTRTPGGSSGGESALIAACGSPLGLGSDAAGSVRLPAAFCGIASIKPTSGRLPRTGHVPPAAVGSKRFGKSAPWLAMSKTLCSPCSLLAHEDDDDFTSPPVALLNPPATPNLRIAYFTHNGFATCNPEIKSAVEQCAKFFAGEHMIVEEIRPPGSKMPTNLNSPSWVPMAPKASIITCKTSAAIKPTNSSTASSITCAPTAPLWRNSPNAGRNGMNTAPTSRFLQSLRRHPLPRLHPARSGTRRFSTRRKLPRLQLHHGLERRRCAGRHRSLLRTRGPAHQHPNRYQTVARSPRPAALSYD